MTLSSFEVVTFDCYGTIIDWESGIVAALEPVFRSRGIGFSAPEILERFGQLESKIQAADYLEYRTVLRGVLLELATEASFTPAESELQAFAESVAQWPPFPDSAEALKRIQRRRRIIAISNIDDDLFAASAKLLGVEFNLVITAQQSRAYKPSMEMFDYALARVGVDKGRVLHVAQSLFHDIRPARELGLTTVWVNRQSRFGGSGATPIAAAEPDVTVRDLAELAELLDQ